MEKRYCRGPNEDMYYILSCFFFFKTLPEEYLKKLAGFKGSVIDNGKMHIANACQAFLRSLGD